MPVGATTFNVDRTDDVIASGCNDGVPNDCSLRGAIIAANGSPGGDIINLPAGTYVLTGLRCEDAAATGKEGETEAVLRKYLQMVKTLKGPILLHVVTEKGHGFQPAAVNVA